MTILYTSGNTVLMNVFNGQVIPREGDLVEILNKIYKVSYVVWCFNEDDAYVKVQLK